MSKKIIERGITLIALVVTIIILLILAGVTLSLSLSQNGLFSRTQNAADKYKKAQDDEIKMLDDLKEQLGENSTGNNPSITPQVTPPKKDIPETVKEAKDEEYVFEDTETVTDELGNSVVIPGTFKISGESGDTVEDGIVIEDDEGNQFVWIPVSNIGGEDKKENNKLIKKENEEVEIVLRKVYL